MAKKQAPKKTDTLADLRAEIDALDEKLVALLNKRAEVVVRVGKAKQTSGTAIYAPDREHEVLKRIGELNAGPLPDRTIHAIWREMMSGSFVLEKPLRIAFLGPEGSFSHLAAMRKFGASVEYMPVSDIATVFTEVRRGHTDLGVTPIENSIGGGVIETLDAFQDGSIHVIAEVIAEIHHNLLATCPADGISMIASKPEIFSQCRRWLGETFHKADLIPTASSAKAAEMAARQQGLAAIGSSLAAELYGLKIVFENIEDNPGNQTRFFVIGNKPTGPTGDDKTSLMFITHHKPGALAEVLDVFRRWGINMTNIDTRPSKRQNWEYVFFVDCEGHQLEDHFARALGEIKEHCLELVVLGSYPRARDAV